MNRRYALHCPAIKLEARGIIMVSRKKRYSESKVMLQSLTFVSRGSIVRLDGDYCGKPQDVVGLVLV
jgi:hypothetical protein